MLIVKHLFIVSSLLLLLTACGGSTPTITGDQVVGKLKAAGLEAEKPAPMTKEDYGLAPFVCKGTHFFTPSVDDTAGGRIYVCEDEKERDSLKAYYDALGKGSAMFFSWTFAKGSVLVQVNGDLPEAKARQYEAVVNALP